MFFVIIQFASIIYLLINTNWQNFNLISYLLVLVSIFIAIIAFFNMGVKNISILPQLKNNHILITNGIYKYIRHPMYSSIIIFSLALLISNINYTAIIIYVILIIDLYLKSSLEEKYLSKRFSQYLAYKDSTRKFF